MRNKFNSKPDKKLNADAELDPYNKEYYGSGQTSIDIIEDNSAYNSAGRRKESNKPFMQKSIKRIIMAIVLILAVIFAGSILFVTIKTYYYTTKQTNDYIVKAGEIQEDLKLNLEAVNEQYITEELKTVFSKDDIYVFSYNLWSYGLYINDKKIESTVPLSVSPGDKIYIKETWKKTVLPAEFINIGSLTRGDVNDNLSNHFALSEKTFNIKQSKTKQTNIYTITGADFKSGDRFNIMLSDQLARRLNFVRNVIAVRVR